MAVMAATASLGRWQLSRAAQKEALQRMMDLRMAEPPLSTDEFVSRLQGMEPMSASAPDPRISDPGMSDPQKDGLLHRQVLLTGQWLAQHTVYLDNRQMRGRQGFFVMTPLRLDDAARSVVMVQRGWVPRNFEDRTQIPSIRTASGQVRVAGRVAAHPARLFEFGTSGGGARASSIRQNLDLAAFGAETGLTLLPLSVVQTAGDADDGMLRDWPAVDTGIDKHYGYAFQWFGLCGLVAILYVWFQLFRRFLRPRSQPPA
ncbi:SURF1 family protein [Diaphorobacter ruginosibacter]|uniref:SURF1 family protein n=1 Tax=Diaphorobacter ruginosibacter TaxID=1715720 RepID=UPI003340A5DA